MTRLPVWAMVLLGCLVSVGASYSLATVFPTRAQVEKVAEKADSGAAKASEAQDRSKATVRYLQGRRGSPGLTGPPGSPGIGERGATGRRGRPGQSIRGRPGEAGTPGKSIEGPPGSDGKPGADAPPVTSEALSDAVAAYCENHNDCRGPAGADGSNGRDGVDGAQGPPGPPGSNATAVGCTVDLISMTVVSCP